jgi:peptidoglycan/LPS O-acetylase OafA/YrhL
MLFGAAPLGFGLLRAWGPGHDPRFVWMSLAPSLFAVGVLAAAIGRRRTRHAMINQSAAILVVATLLAGGMAFLLGARADPGVWAVAIVTGFCLATSSVLVGFSRPSTG